MEETGPYEKCSALDAACHLENLSTALARFFAWIWQTIIDGLVAVLSAIPVPSWMSGGTFTLPDGVMWFASALELNTGVGIVLSAYTIRFLIRRLPVIG